MYAPSGCHVYEMHDRRSQCAVPREERTFMDPEPVVVEARDVLERVVPTSVATARPVAEAGEGPEHGRARRRLKHSFERSQVGYRRTLEVAEKAAARLAASGHEGLVEQLRPIVADWS